MEAQRFILRAMHPTGYLDGHQEEHPFAPRKCGRFIDWMTRTGKFEGQERTTEEQDAEMYERAVRESSHFPCCGVTPALMRFTSTEFIRNRQDRTSAVNASEC